MKGVTQINGDEHLFTCKDCGSHDLQIKESYTTTHHYTKELACKCGDAPDGVAATRSGYATVEYFKYGALNGEHRVEWGGVEELGMEARDMNEEREVACLNCLKSARDNAFEITDVKTETEKDKDSHKFFVRCGGCSQEIERGNQWFSSLMNRAHQIS
jgi:Zn finger protein HypA/HybF involved in hydrogenase expression